MANRLSWALCLAIVFLGTVGSAGAQADQPELSAPAQKKLLPEAVDSVESDGAAEAAVLDFVKEHQPQLADLLSFLKKKKSKDYNEAMRESRKVRERLLSIKDRDPEMYQVELAIWQNAAQIRLLAAAASARSKKLSDEDRARLEELLQRENELNIKRLTLEKTRLEARVNQLSQQLTRREEQSESIVSKTMKMWENRIERSGSRPKNKDTGK